MSFRQRLTLFLVIALVAIQAATATLGFAYLRDNAIKKGQRDLEAATGVFRRQLNVVSDRVTDGVNVLSLDYALRQSIAQNDHATELSALRNHGHRIGATRMMLVGLDGRISADTGAPSNLAPFAFPDLLGEAMEAGEGTALATLGDRVYWVVVVPVRAPLPIAFVTACIPISDAMLEQFRELSTTSRSLALAVRTRSGNWQLVAQSANHPAMLPMPGRGQSAMNLSSVVRIGGDDWVTATAPLKTAANSAPVAVIQGYPLRDTLSEFESLVWPMLLIVIAALGIAVAGSIVIVRGMTRPLEALAARAGRIATGDYSPAAPIREGHELGQLSRALTDMTNAIAEREAALTAALANVEASRGAAVRANEAKSKFLANMSHELRTPLNAIVGFSEMMSAEVLGPMGQRRYLEYARDIHASGGHLLTLVSRMLDLADAEAGLLQIGSEVFSVAAIAQGAVARLRPLADKGGVAVAVPAVWAGWPMLGGDAAKLDQALSGIVHNAIKFTPSGGRVEVSGVQRGHQFVLTVADTGIGMSEENIAVAVLPFQRLRSALDGEHQGAGLGLSFAKAIVEAHNGTLHIESEPSIGTRVEIALPLSTALASDAA